ncbi:MAG TPA: hypothetical protein PKK13_05930, partial [Spirochaetota bacterium]|nr:hypothetical protein [Spirochaetota bacterium]
YVCKSCLSNKNIISVYLALRGSKMNYDFSTIPEKVMEHLKKIQSRSTLPQDEETLKRLVESWLSKRGLFDKIVDHNNLKKIELFDKNSAGGCIAMTLSGSILAIGPIQNGKRKANYASIGIRTDVFEKKSEENSELEFSLEIDKPAYFIAGPVKSTSMIIDIAVFKDIEDINRQIEQIEHTEVALYDKFIEVNKNIYPENYNKDDLKNRDDLFNKWIILDWFRIGGLQEQIFLARAKMLWVELFSKIYDKLSKSNADDLDNKMLEFANNTFSGYIDDYKWFESEKKTFDIGLMKALEELPSNANYQKFLEEWS